MLRLLKNFLLPSPAVDTPLLVDILFPTQYSQWRIAETTSFIKEKRADILVFKIDEFAGITYDVDYEIMRSRQGFADYNILIFDPKYNHLNQYNQRIDGTRANGSFPASYLFTRHTHFDLRRYTFAYHIFLMCYEKFNSAATFPRSRQVVRLYPGGGFLDEGSLQVLDPTTHVITTHPRTSSALRDMGHTRVLECLGGSFISRDMPQFVPKPLKQGKLTVCFASMGHAKEKGSDHFLQIAKTYHDVFPRHNVRFVAISKAAFPKPVERVAPMAMHDLMEFYQQEVDIIISIDTAKAFNGWPLGVEAALNGAVLITTDSSNANRHYGFPDDSLFIFNHTQIEPVVELIRQLELDRHRLLTRSRRCQQAFLDFYAYEKQQGRVFEYLDDLFARPQ